MGDYFLRGAPLDGLKPGHSKQARSFLAVTGIAGESLISVRVTAAALNGRTNKMMTQENVLAEVTNKPRRLWNLSLNDGLRNSPSARFISPRQPSIKG